MSDIKEITKMLIHVGGVELMKEFIKKKRWEINPTFFMPSNLVKLKTLYVSHTTQTKHLQPTLYHH